RTALARATGDYVIIQDADNELDPNDIPRLLEPIREGRAKVVYGARTLRVQSWSTWLGTTVLTLATNLLFGTHLTDMETCYKLMPSAVMRVLDLRSNGFDIEPEITAKLARAGYAIVEVPIAYRPRTEDKKMRPLREGARALGALLHYRFQ
ncbi:partial Undecaprenyl-phosphate mannosyltransferase, partial [Anaerolineae bacterium]